MDAKRAKGRPKRGSGEAGRDLLVAAAQQLLRRPQLELNRTELAVRAGVTPALVTYYFRDQASLIGAVAEPVVARYLGDLKAIVRDPAPAAAKLRALVALVLRVSREDGPLVDGYMAFVQRNGGHEVSLLPELRGELAAFFDGCAREGYLRTVDAAVAGSVIWGACRAVAQGPAPAAGDADDERVTAVVDILLRGLGSPGTA